jgi:hypothetical protein
MEEDWQQEGEDQEDQADDLDDGEEEEDDILDMGEDVATNDKDALLMRFCPHDSSMLYPQVSTVLSEILPYPIPLCGWHTHEASSN